MDMKIPRILDDFLSRRRQGRVTVIYGPRRVGKTTVVNHALGALLDAASPGQRILRATGDDIRLRNLLSSQDRADILAWAQGYDIIFIDEAQRVPDIGWALKLLIDARPDLTIIATGSASFKLTGQLGEPLTGRQTPLAMFPVSIPEMLTIMNPYEVGQNLDDFIIYGMYPEVRTATSATEKAALLTELTSSYLFKDILELDRVRSSKTLIDLLALVALQLGSTVSYNELASTLRIDVKTVARYLDLFEKSYILYSLGGFSRNLRKEIAKSRKYYFYDTGVRNAVINNFNPANLRSDMGGLWENFAIMERIKARSYAGRPAHCYFWRTYDQQEIDLVEDSGGRLEAYECKYSENGATKAKEPIAFAKAYPDAHFSVITPKRLIEDLQAI